MRRVLVATLTAVLAVIGFSAVLAGTASASTPTPTRVITETCSVASGLTCTVRILGHTETCTLSATPTSYPAVCTVTKNVGDGNGADCPGDRLPNVPGCQRDGAGLPGSWNDRLDGRYFRLDRGPALDVCDAGSSSYDVWLNRNSTYRDRIVRQLNAQRWNDLRRADCGVVVSNDGNCITYSTARDSIRTYANDYNRLNGLYRGDWQRLSRADRDNLARLYSAQQRYLNDWNSNLSRLRTICKDDTPPVTIINNVPPTVTVTQAPVAAPAPTYSGSIPSGSVNTGGWSAGFILAHNRAV